MRIATFVDGASFFHMQKDRLRWWVDPKKLLDWIRSLGQLSDAYYYLVVEDPPQPQQESFQKALSYMGFSLTTRSLRLGQEEGGDRKPNSLEIDIVVDLFNTIEHYDLAVLVCAGASFERPLQCLRARGKKYLLMSTQGFVPREIRALAGMHFVDFNDIRDHVEKTA